MTPVRVQLSRSKGWRMPPDTVKVDRTTKWGNPFWVERKPGRMWNPVDGTWDKVFELRHREWLRGPLFNDKARALADAVQRFAMDVAPTLALADLRGLNLACWCKPGAPCHADVLLELANPPAENGASDVQGSVANTSQDVIPEDELLDPLPPIAGLREEKP